MKMKKFGGTERTVYDLVKPIADQFGYSIWDVSFEKEGAYWYLRVFIDHPDGITIEDCEKMTRPVNAAVDAADPIAQAYVLEVGSAGLERELNQPWHFEATLGMEVRARAIRPVDGVREWIGVLTAYDTAQITIQPEDTEEPVTLALEDLSYVRRYVAVEF
ncbi:ribosome maturation factor RimP [uncultured Ruminococcus sp.]|uniref:ribosome maturation factor RimP n=1 Tax=uncultured Ruminococcus sp. TaxID=165186 RepID=UPI002638E466|nr:ribosome maturation factor RimP [uncultured Ruminococcus sp.]